MLRFANLPGPLVSDITENRCLPIVGAGFSRNAELAADLTMPTWNELAERLAKTGRFPHETAIETMSVYAERFGRDALHRELRRLLNIDDVAPGRAHLAFCALPFELVVTTNYDRLLEDGYRAAHRRFRLVVDESDLVAGHSRDTTMLVKLHGDLDHGASVIATEEDFDAFAHRRPLFTTFLASQLIVRTPLFIGYSVNDPDFRQIWQLVRDRLGTHRRRAYAIVERRNTATDARFRRRDIELIS